MKKIITLAAMLCVSFFVFAQKDSTKKISVTRQVMVSRTIRPQKAVVIRKDVVKIKSQLTQFEDSITVTKKEIDALVNTMKNDLDSMGEMGEMETLRMQMAMDRLSKMMSTLSNILKKMSDTAQTITQNLK